MNAGLSGNSTTRQQSYRPALQRCQRGPSQLPTRTTIHCSCSRNGPFRAWYGLSAAYTWSKSIDDSSDALGVLETDTAAQQDPNNNRNNRAVSQFDVPQRLAITHDFLSSSRHFNSRDMNLLLGGWEFAGIFSAQSGLPINILAGYACDPWH